jgi:hypothetical protein
MANCRTIEAASKARPARKRSHKRVRPGRLSTLVAGRPTRRTLHRPLDEDADAGDDEQARGIRVMSEAGHRKEYDGALRGERRSVALLE